MKMNRFWNAVFAAVVLLGLVWAQPGLAAPGMAQSGALVVGEGNDFATRVLRDAWDMDAYSDVSQYLNQSGQNINISVPDPINNGLFTYTTLNKEPAITVLDTGYETAMKIGKVGYRYPIDPSTYKCLYLAAGSSAFNPTANGLRIMWFADSKLNDGIFGTFVSVTTTGSMKLYRYNLDDPTDNAWSSTSVIHAPWNQTKWQGLRLEPIKVAGVTQSIDWVRLTDCAPQNVTIFNIPSGSYTPEITHNGVTILMDAVDSDGKTLNLDMSGVEPDTYAVVLRAVTGAVAWQGTITVTPAPVASFEKPGPNAGALFPADWSMTGAGSITEIRCTAYSFSGGKLNLNTPTLAQQPAECGGLAGGNNDPIFWLNTPTPIDPNQYRYFNIQMSSSGDVNAGAGGTWQNVPRGMVARVGWVRQSGTSKCNQVTHDIPFDVGDHLYTIDLWDAFQGQPEESHLCDFPRSWRDSGPVIEMRFDPNENEMGIPLQQAIDMITLTGEETTPLGANYTTRFTLNTPFNPQTMSRSFVFRPVGGGADYPAPIVVTNPVPLAGQYRLYIPGIQREGNYLLTLSGDSLELNTSAVPAGSYYLCMTVNDGLNKDVVSCSEYPVRFQ